MKIHFPLPVPRRNHIPPCSENPITAQFGAAVRKGQARAPGPDAVAFLAVAGAPERDEACRNQTCERRSSPGDKHNALPKQRLTRSGACAAPLGPRPPSHPGGRSCDLAA